MVDTDPPPLTEEPPAYRPGLFAAFRRRRAEADPADVRRREDRIAHDAYEQGRRDAYQRGRRDERARRRGSPLLSLLVLLIALAGGAMVYLAAREGSFAGGGQVVDRAIGHAAAPARSAAGRTGEALEQAGQSLKKESGSSEAG